MSVSAFLLIVAALVGAKLAVRMAVRKAGFDLPPLPRED